MAEISNTNFKTDTNTQLGRYTIGRFGSSWNLEERRESCTLLRTKAH